MSKIEWTDITWNPIRALHGGKTGWHCVKVSEGCRNCYAERMNQWRGTGQKFKAGSPAEVYLDQKVLMQPLKWRKPCKVFVCDMTDLFGEWVANDWLDQIYAVMALCPQHTFQVLTKRPRLVAKYLSGFQRTKAIDSAKCNIMGNMPDSGRGVDAYVGEEGSGYFEDGYLANLWLGTSIEDQATADARILQLLKCPAAVRFLSVEPMLGEIELPFSDLAVHARIERQDGTWEQCRKIHWAITGGESGPGARPAKLDWFHSLRDQCKAAGVPFFMKQFGSVLGKELGIANSKGGGDMSLWPESVQDLAIREMP